MIMTMNKPYSPIFNRYDLHHLELIVAVSQNSHIFLIVRAYKEPDVNMMSVVKEKQSL